MPSIFNIFLLYFEEWMNFYPLPLLSVCCLVSWLGQFLMHGNSYFIIWTAACKTVISNQNEWSTLFFFLTIETKVTNNNTTRSYRPSFFFLWNIILLLSWLMATFTLRENSLNYISTLPNQFATGFIVDLVMSRGKVKGAQYFNLEVVGSRSHYQSENKNVYEL